MHCYFRRLEGLGRLGPGKVESIKKLAVCVRLFRTVALKQPRIFKEIIDRLGGRVVQVETFDVVFGIMLWEESEVALSGPRNASFGSELSKVMEGFERLDYPENFMESFGVFEKAHTSYSGITSNHSHWIHKENPDDWPHKFIDLVEKIRGFALDI